MPSKKLSKADKLAQGKLAWDPVGLMAGVDEAGRGPLAGPVVAAAVILDDSKRIRGLADSKVLTPLQRDKLYDQILEKALCCSVGQATVEEIDTLNILHATMLAMKRAVEGLRLKPIKVLVDGNRLPTIDVLAEAVIGGDATVKAISAASILAKVHRDRLCKTLDEEFPQYGFAAHKGYGTPEHLEALRVHGACRHHRRFFSPVAATFITPDGKTIVLRTS
jgi:ribonuclease HII